MARTQCAYLFRQLGICAMHLNRFFPLWFGYSTEFDGAFLFGRKSVERNSIPQNAILPSFQQKSLKYATHNEVCSICSAKKLTKLRSYTK